MNSLLCIFYLPSIDTPNQSLSPIQHVSFIGYQFLINRCRNGMLWANKAN